jgi:apolipoprotein D and lipocalin family protein
MKSRIFVLTAVTVTLVVLAGLQASARANTLEIVDDLDVKRYAGTWYEIARLPNWFERNCSGDITANYSINADGTIAVSNRCTKKNGVAEAANGIGRFKDPELKKGHLKVTFAPGWLRFLPFVWADYCVIYLDDGYKFALIGEPGRKYLWVLAREKNIDKEQLDKMLQIAEKQGFNLSKLIRNF